VSTSSFSLIKGILTMHSQEFLKENIIEKKGKIRGRKSVKTE
jgi:hypothetical protein